MAEILDPKTLELATTLSDNPMEIFKGKSLGYLEDLIRVTVGAQKNWTPPVGTFLSLATDLSAQTGEYIHTDAFGVQYLYWNGVAISRTIYADLFANLVPLLGTFTVTIASPAVATLTTHGLTVGTRVYLTTTGALPTGLAQNTIYFVASVPTASTFTLSATDGGAAINTSGSQSGVHSLRRCPFGLGDGSTTFNLGDCRGRTLFYCGTNVGASQGDNDGATEANRQAKHAHTNGVTGSITGAPAVGSLAVTGAPGIGSLAVTGAPGGTFATSGNTVGDSSDGAGGTNKIVTLNTASPTIGTLAVGGAPSVGSLAVGGAPSAGSLGVSVGGTVGTGTAGDAPGHLFIGSLLVRF